MQTIFITGVGQRVGLHLANHFIDQGFKVIGSYRTERPAIEELRSKGALLYCCDFYQPSDVNRLVENILSECSSLRAIIHNASDWHLDAGADIEVIEKMMRVHVYAPYQMNLALSPLLMNSHSEFSDILHFSDYVASTGSPKHSAYAASKAALENLTLSMAAKFAPKIKVNAIAPALILFNETDDQAYREKAIKKSLIEREGGLDEVTLAVEYLLASGYITGRILPLDGGRHLARKS